MAALIPYIGSAATAAATYLGFQTLQAATDAATTALTNVMQETARQTAIAATAYVSSLFLEKQCENSRTFQKNNCNSTFEDIACAASKVKEIASCCGDAAITVVTAYHAVKTVSNAAKSISPSGKK